MREKRKGKSIMTKQELNTIIIDNTPTQVMFWIGAEEGYCGGILFGSTIICGCCGNTFDVFEVLDEAKRAGKVGIYRRGWADITGEIADGWTDWTEEDNE
jgi:hypothetical protein